MGDFIIVNVDDISSLQFNLTLKNNSDSTTTSTPDVTITGFLPKVQGNQNIKNNDATTFNGKSSFSFSIASRIQKREGGEVHCCWHQGLFIQRGDQYRGSNGHNRSGTGKGPAGRF